MNVTKSLIALTIAAGFATASFAQGAAAPAAEPTAKIVAPAPAAAEKKVEAPKAAVTKPAKAVKHHHQAKKAAKAEAAPVTK